ncbi:hypothetical protein [Mycetocola zhujimingii]|uniref:hypothetical protein n=1 Tax=Mycetocola zhujimingii TaxID=2079792 RepID=UPI0011B1F430|nr:hypothetical protein [Mycetocola zhujimingii]
MAGDLSDIVVDLLSPGQLAARARMRRERAIGDSQSDWSILIEGWSGGRQVFAFALPTLDALAGPLLVARSALNVDTVVLFTDSRVFALEPGDVDGQRTAERYQRGEVSLLELAMAGDPRVIDQLVILPFSVERGVLDPQMIRYLTRYESGRESGVIWDVDGDEPMTATISGSVHGVLTWAMQDNAVGPDGQLAQPGEALMWEELDAHLLGIVAAALNTASEGRFVILDAHPKVATAAGFAPLSAPGGILIGDTTPESVEQLVAWEVAR